MGRPRTDISTRILHAARARFLVDGVDGASLRTIAKDAKTNIGMIFYYYPTKDALFLAVVEEVYGKLMADFEAALHPFQPAHGALHSDHSDQVGAVEPRSVAVASDRSGSLKVVRVRERERARERERERERENAREDARSLRVRLARVFARVGHATPEELDVIRLVVREALVSSPRLQELLSRFRRGHIGLVLSALAEGVERGELDAKVPLPFLLTTTAAMGVAPQLLRRIAGDQMPFAQMPDPEALAATSVELLFRAIGARSSPAPPMPEKNEKEALRQTKQKRKTTRPTKHGR